MSSRLAFALESGAVDRPVGRMVVFHPPVDTDLSMLAADDVQIVHGFKPAFDTFTARGFQTVVAPEGDFAAALVCVPRAKKAAQALIAEAMARSGGGPVIVDGDKQNGIESLLKACRARSTVSAPVSKAHGKLFVVSGGDYSDWQAEPQSVDGFRTVPGVFSADGVDDASAALAAALPSTLPKHMADLGAGWGYLASQVLQRAGVATLHLVEAEHAALDCARVNVTDPRAVFHWADATTFTPPEPLDAIVTNPPFHQGRAAEPELGRAFIRAASGMLKPSGRLWLVANRHLPYETEARAHFGSVEEVGGDSRFKVLLAVKPLRRPRR